MCVWVCVCVCVRFLIRVHKSFHETNTPHCCNYPTQRRNIWGIYTTPGSHPADPYDDRTQQYDSRRLSAVVDAKQPKILGKHCGPGRPSPDRGHRSSGIAPAGGVSAARALHTPRTHGSLPIVARLSSTPKQAKARPRGGLNHPILPRGLRRIRRAPPRESSAQSPRRFRGLPRSPRRT